MTNLLVDQTGNYCRITMTSSVNNMALPDLYKQVNRTIDNGIAGYYVQKKYEDPL